MTDLIDLEGNVDYVLIDEEKLQARIARRIMGR